MMDKAEKANRYGEVETEISAVLEGETNPIAQMATVSNILHHAFPYFFWTGFYIVDPQKKDELVVGPYQGTLGCLRIPFERGVCGAAATTGEIQIVDDVHEFPGHIACDARSRSEIVIPVHNNAGELLAVFDVDSDQPAMFDKVDAAGLSAILKQVFP